MFVSVSLHAVLESTTASSTFERFFIGMYLDMLFKETFLSCSVVAFITLKVHREVNLDMAQ